MERASRASSGTMPLQAPAELVQCAPSFYEYYARASPNACSVERVTLVRVNYASYCSFLLFCIEGYIPRNTAGMAAAVEECSLMAQVPLQARDRQRPQ